MRDKQNEVDKKSSQKKGSGGIGTMNLILIIVGVSALAFTVCMIWIFLTYAAIPDMLCTCVFTLLGGECGVMGVIKSFKEKYREWEWKKEDEREAMENAQANHSSDDGRDPNEM